MIGRHGTCTTGASVTGLLGPPEERRERDDEREDRDHAGGGDRQVTHGQGDGRAEEAAQRPRAVERREDRPVVEVLERHRLHVGGRVDRAERHAVHRHRGDEDGLVRSDREDRHGHRDPEQPGAQEHGAVDAAAGGLGGDAAQPGEQHHHQQQQREGRVAVVPVVLHLRQPGGQADEDEALGEEAGGRGAAGPGVLGSRHLTRRGPSPWAASWHAHDDAVAWSGLRFRSVTRVSSSGVAWSASWPCESGVSQMRARRGRNAVASSSVSKSRWTTTRSGSATERSTR